MNIIRVNIFLYQNFVSSINQIGGISMVTVEQAKKNTELMLRLYNTFRKEPISLEEFKQEHQCESEKKHHELITLLKKYNKV